MGEAGNETAHTCAWSRHAESLLPWKDLTKMNTSDADGFYTNRELMQLFHPASLELPFVFDTFDWGHCAGWDGERGEFEQTVKEEDMPVWKQNKVQFVRDVMNLGTRRHSDESIHAPMVFSEYV